MLNSDLRISLADLAAAGIRLRPPDAVAIVHELVQQVGRGEIPGVPSPHVIRIDTSGQLYIEGPVAAGSRPVSRAAQLLETLLPPFDAPSESRVPGALRLILARAMGTLDVPPYPSLEAFAEALGRFSPADRKAALRDLASRWASAAEQAARVQSGVSSDPSEASSDKPEPAPEPVSADAGALTTISDIRRARRSSGLPLAEVSSRSRIPVALLRQLEWGYLRHWPMGLYGRTQLVRYARASGLDEQMVVRAMWPVLEATVRERTDESADTAVAHAVDGVIVETVPTDSDIPLVHTELTIPAEGRRRSRLGVWLAAAAALLLAILPLARARFEQPAATPVEAPAPVAATSPVGSTGPASEPVQTASGPPIDSGRSSTPADAPIEDKRPQTPVAANASDVRQLTDDVVAYSPAFASVGSAMFYQEESGQTSALLRADTDGQGSILRITRVVDDNSRNFHARPSPDGTRIAFDSDREGERGVYVANADGTDVKRVSGEGYAAVPSWSPDGKSLAYVRAEPDRPNVWNLWTLDLGTGDTRRLTSHRYGQPWGGSWFPDGRRLAYSHEDRLIVLDLESGREKIYPSPRQGRLVRTPAVSPDGRLIIFQVRRDGAWLLDVDDGSMRKVLADPTAEEYAWSPDGRRVAYHSRRSGEWGVWLMAAR